jgi:hypothetical protein
MKSLFLRTVCLGVLVAVLWLAPPVSADVYMKQVTHSDAAEMMGQKQPARDDTTSLWFSEDMALMEQSNGASMLVDMNDGVMYQIDHNAKAYAIIPVGLMTGSDKGSELVSEQTRQMIEQMKQMMASMAGQVSATVTPTDETKTIGEWDTKKYIMELSLGMGSVQSIVWATDDIEIGQDIYEYVITTEMMQLPGVEKLMTEMKKIEGVHVLTENTVNMMGNEVKSTTKLVEYKEADAPEGTFVLPDGYEERPWNPMQEN